MMNSLISASVNWTTVGLVLGITAGLAVVFSILIIVVTKLCHVHEDERS